MSRKIISFPHTEREASLTGEELINELSIVTSMPIKPKCKLLLVDYLMKHYFALDKDDEIHGEIILS